MKKSLVKYRTNLTKSYSVDGKMLLEDVNDLFGLELDDSQCDTIGGWVYTQLNTQPQIGQTVKLPPLNCPKRKLPWKKWKPCALPA